MLDYYAGNHNTTKPAFEFHRHRAFLRTIPEPLRNHPEDVFEVIGHVMPRFVARPVALPLAREGLPPELLRDALLHDPANLTAGRVALDVDRQVSQALAAQEFEPLFRKDSGAAFDILLLGKEGNRMTLHNQSICVSTNIYLFHL